MASYGPMSTVVCDIGWYNAPEAVVGVSIVTRRSTCTTRSGSTAFPAGAPTCRKRRLDGTRESRMRAICMSGLMSGDWKRTYGANCDTGVSESGRKQSSSRPTDTAPVVDSTLCGISTPSLPVQGEQRRLTYFNIERDNSWFVGTSRQLLQRDILAVISGHRQFVANDPKRALLTLVSLFPSIFGGRICPRGEFKCRSA